MGSCFLVLLYTPFPILSSRITSKVSANTDVTYVTFNNICFLDFAHRLVF